MHIRVTNRRHKPDLRRSHGISLRNRESERPEAIYLFFITFISPPSPPQSPSSSSPFPSNHGDICFFFKKRGTHLHRPSPAPRASRLPSAGFAHPRRGIGAGGSGLGLGCRLRVRGGGVLGLGGLGCGYLGEAFLVGWGVWNGEGVV